METKHYKAPWRAEGWQGIVVNDAEGCTLALCPGNIRQDGLEVIKANARLIAAAPAMYEALIGLFSECFMTHKTWGDGNNRQAAYEAMKAANDAIALAEGREVTA